MSGVLASALPWQNGAPRHLWSFSDLIECKVPYLMQAYEQLRGICDSLYQYPDLRAELRDEQKDSFSRYSFFQDLEWSKDVIDDQRIALNLWSLHVTLAGKNPMTPELLIRELESIKHDLILVMSQRTFAYIPKEVAAYFEQDKLFGGAVYDRFPAVRDDVKDAGNCIAAGLPTAAMFHLMRVAEFGFRFAAKRGRIPLVHNGKKLPVEFATWEKVIQGLNGVASKNKGGKSVRQERKAEFYASLADQCSYFRDIWRDKTMHARRRYNHSEAVGAFLRVQEFMSLLARAK